MLSLEIGELGEAGFDLSLTGFDEFELGELFAERTQGRTDPDDAPHGLIFFDCFSKRAHLRRPGRANSLDPSADQGSVDRPDHGGNPVCVGARGPAPRLARSSRPGPGVAPCALPGEVAPHPECPAAAVRW